MFGLPYLYTEAVVCLGVGLLHILSNQESERVKLTTRLLLLVSLVEGGVASECYRRRGFGMLYKKRLGLAYLCVEVYVQRLVARAKLF